MPILKMINLMSLLFLEMNIKFLLIVLLRDKHWIFMNDQINKASIFRDRC